MSTKIECTQLLEIDAGDWTNAVTFSTDGKNLIGGAGRTVGVWRVKDGERVATIQRHSDVLSVAVSKDGRYIAVVLFLRPVVVWDARTYKQVFADEIMTPKDGRRTGVASLDVDFSPDSTHLVAGNGAATIWDIAMRQKVRTLGHSDGSVYAARYAPQGDRIATATHESVRVWDSNDGRVLVDIKAAVLGPSSLQFDDLYLFVATRDKKIKRIDATTGSTISDWRVPDVDSSSHIALPQHGKFIAHCTQKTITFWDTETHTQLGPAQHIDSIRSLAFSPDGQLLAILSREKIIVKAIVSHPVLDPGLYIDSAALNAWKQGLLIDAEALLTVAIPTFEETSHLVLACRALVRARLGQCDTALADAEKSIEIQQSLVGYVAKCVALVLMGEKDKGIGVCDIASRRFQDHATLLFLIRAIVLFMSGEHVDAISYMDDLITDSTHHSSVDPALYVVQAYMRLLHKNKHVESSDYECSFEDMRVGVGNYTFRPPLIVSLISGWVFDDLAITIQQRLCEALYTADRTMEAAMSVLHMVDQEASLSEPMKTWVSDFKYRCRRKLKNLGDRAFDAKQYDEAVSQYTTALSLDPASPQDFLVQRSRAFAAMGIWKDALNDANEVIKLDPSSLLGYERKYQAVRGAGHASDAIAAFEMMISKMSESPDPDIRERSRHYVKPEATQETIRSVIKNVINDSPPVLINVNSGRLCNKSERITAFESTPIFAELICSMTTQIDHTLIEKVVGKYFRYATFSHTWEGAEPLYENVVKIVVYDLEASPTHTKLQMFCKIAQDEGFEWAWSDTCCIDKGDHFVLQEALVRMFKWYEGSAMTIIFLFDVDELAELGALVMSKWNSRGWTLQEYHASKVVRIYTKNWKPYLGLTIYNHKESPEVMSEMEQATGISARALMALRPGLNDIREKLCLASTRQTTRVEDAAYSLLGIFSMTLPVTYGEDDKALGRLLSQLLTSSGDSSILAWTGIPGSFNSCLPANIAVFSQPLSSHIPPTIADAVMVAITAGLRDPSLDINLATRLHARVDELPTPTFVGQRIRFPCLAFKIRLVSGRQDCSEFLFGAEASTIGTVEIRTKQNLQQLGSLYLVHPWIGFLLDRHAAGSIAEMAAEDKSPKLDDFSFDSSANPSSTLHTGSSSLTGRPAPKRVYKFLTRLRQPFGALLHVSNPRNTFDSSTAPSGTLHADLSSSTVPERIHEFLARLGQPFGALLLASNPRNTAEYRRVATESLITVQVKEITSATLNQLIQCVRVLDVL